MAATTTTLPLATYPEEAKEYISSTTIHLKPSKRTQSLGRRPDLLDNLTFEWHTNVSTPPNTPVVAMVEKPVQQANNHASQQHHHHHASERTKDLFLPAFTFEEEDNLPTKVDKFMACERYHSQYQQSMTKRTTNL